MPTDHFLDSKLNLNIMICETFRKLAFDTWYTIKKSRTVSFQMKEETFTDQNMLELKLSHPNEVKTVVFTKPQECIYGADWEWWFTDYTNKWIGFRIQAKIINYSTNEFTHLHYRSGRKRKYQCENLINLSMQSPPLKTPLYCLYTQTDDPIYLNNWNCGSFPPSKELYGCSLISAFEIRKLRRQNRRHLSDVENLLSPWHCLVCCKGYGGNSPVEQINNFSMERFWKDRKIRNKDFIKPESLVANNPPEYVINSLENTSIKPPDPELHILMIITLKENEVERK